MADLDEAIDGGRAVPAPEERVGQRSTAGEETTRPPGPGRRRRCRGGRTASDPESLPLRDSTCLRSARGRASPLPPPAARDASRIVPPAAPARVAGRVWPTGRAWLLRE